MCVIGLASVAIVGNDPQFFDGGNVGGKLLGGANMITMNMAKALGGDVFFGFLAAVAFATILAVVSGLVLAGASAISHDLYANVLRRGTASEASQLRVTKQATIVIGAIAIMLGLLFRGQNLAFLIALVFSVAASANFPPLILSMYWRGLTSRGAVWGGLTGLMSSVGLVILSPAIWKSMLGHPQAIFPYEYPAVISMPLAFLVTWLVSRLDRSARAESEQGRFDDQFVRAQTGFGAAQATDH
ncbi:hypothetical protein [Cupriavidus sp. WKF15]|uniref:sodium:solute symporter family transporter n=1 Tax=Cupriavidus sp. WKF15 TaxID=3032282 RepID=UPI0031FF0DA1